MWVPTGVNFVARFLSDPWFFRRNRRISNDYELHALRGNTTSELSTTTTATKTRKWAKKTSQHAAHFCKVRCRHRKTDVVKLNWNDNAIVALVSKILVFINGDLRDFDFVGNTHTETHIYSFLGIFTFGLCVLLQWKSLDIKIVCSKDYLHVGITIKVTNFSNQSFITNTCHDTLSDSRLHALFLLPENSVEFELRVHIM